MNDEDFKSLINDVVRSIKQDLHIVSKNNYDYVYIEFDNNGVASVEVYQGGELINDAKIRRVDNFMEQEMVGVTTQEEDVDDNLNYISSIKEYFMNANAFLISKCIVGF